MEKTQNKDIKSILENTLDFALITTGKCYEYSKVVAESDKYYHIFVMRIGTNEVHYYIQWSKNAKYFCGIIDFLSTTVNPIFAEKVQRASNEVNRQIEDL